MAYLPNWQVTGLPALSNGTYILSATANDNALNTVTKSVRFTIANTPSDKLPPTVTITSPKNGSSYTSLTTATGTATDNIGGSGVAKVTVRLSRIVAGVTSYSAGSATWTPGYNPAINELPALFSGSSWSFNTSALGTGSYAIRATATDKAGNAAPSATVSFSIVAPPDKIRPTVSITKPTMNGVYAVGLLPQAVGTASDNVGVTSVVCVLQRLTKTVNGKPVGAPGYWSGTTWTAASHNLAVTTLSAATGSTNTRTWTLTLPQLDPGTYSIMATATDKAGNSGSLTYRFTIKAVTRNEPPVLPPNDPPVTVEAQPSDPPPPDAPPDPNTPVLW